MRRGMGSVISFFIQSLRQLVPLLIWVALFILKLVTTAAISLIIGVPEATDRIAREQEMKAVESGKLLSTHARKFYWLVRIVAVLVVLAGWICLSFTTVYLVMLIF